MDLLSIGKEIAKLGAPILGDLIGGPAGGIIGSLISHALGGSGKADADEISSLINANPEQAKITLQKLENENSQYLAQMQALQAQAVQTGQTMRVEYGSSDKYVRRWRPTWGYVTAGAWAVEALAVVTGVVGATYLSLVGKPGGPELLSGMTTLTYALSALWVLALAVLGVNVVQRSKDKQTQKGVESASLITKIAKNVLDKSS